MTKIYVLIIFLILLYAAFQFAFFIIYLVASKDLSALSSPYSQRVEESDTSILIVGDSTGVGVGAPTPRESIAGRLGNDLPEVDITNLSRVGTFTHEIASTFLNIRGGQFDLILIQIGANDILYHTNLSDLRISIVQILSEAVTLGDRVVLMTSGNVGSAPIFPFPVDLIFSKRTRDVRKIFIEESEKQGAYYVDLYRKRRDDAFLKDPNGYFAHDRFHPSGDGYELWYRELRQVLEKNNILF